jgi:hypothetical protein
MCLLQVRAGIGALHRIANAPTSKVCRHSNACLVQGQKHAGERRISTTRHVPISNASKCVFAVGSMVSAVSCIFTTRHMSADIDTLLKTCVCRGIEPRWERCILLRDMCADIDNFLIQTCLAAFKRTGSELRWEHACSITRRASEEASLPRDGVGTNIPSIPVQVVIRDLFLPALVTLTCECVPCRVELRWERLRHKHVCRRSM